MQHQSCRGVLRAYLKPAGARLVRSSPTHPAYTIPRRTACFETPVSLWRCRAVWWWAEATKPTKAAPCCNVAACRSAACAHFNHAYTHVQYKLEMAEYNILFTGF